MKIAQMKLILISTNGTTSLIRSVLRSSKQFKICQQSLKTVLLFQKHKKSEFPKTFLNTSYRSKYKI